MHHLIPPTVHQWSIIRAGTGVAQSWNFLSSPSCRKAGAAARGREVSSPPRSWTLEGRTNLLLSWKHPASPRWSALLPSLFQPSSWSCRAQGTTFLLVIAAKPQLDRHSEDFQGSITTAALELFFRGEAGDCSQNWAHTQAVPQLTSVAQSIWISFLQIRGETRQIRGLLWFNKSPSGCLALAFGRVETALVAKIKAFSETGFLNGEKHVFLQGMGYSVKWEKLLRGKNQRQEY